MVKKQYFALYKLGKKDVELRTVKSQWKSSKVGDIAAIQCGRNTLRKSCECDQRTISKSKGVLTFELEDVV